MLQHDDGSQFPLHLKMVQRINMVVADSLITPENSKAWQHAKKCIFDVNTFENLKLPAPTYAPRDANVQDVDIPRLISYGIIRRIEPEQVKAWVGVFTSVEWTKKRRRLIIDCYDINERLTDA